MIVKPNIIMLLNIKNDLLFKLSNSIKASALLSPTSYDELLPKLRSIHALKILTSSKAKLFGNLRKLLKSLHDFSER